MSLKTSAIPPAIKERLTQTPKHLRTHATVIKELDRASKENQIKFEELNRNSSQHLYTPQIKKLMKSMSDLVSAMRLLSPEEVAIKDASNPEEYEAIKAEVRLQRLFACETVEHVEKHVWPVLQPENGEIIDLQFFPQTIELLEETNRVFISLIKKENNIPTLAIESHFQAVTENYLTILSKYDEQEKTQQIKPTKEKKLLFAAIVVASAALLCMASIVLMTAWPLMLGVLMAGAVVSAIAAVIYLKHKSEKKQRLGVVPELKRQDKMYQLHKSTLFRVDEVRFLLNLPILHKNRSREFTPSVSPELA